jgi:hypothetical protein
MDKTRSFKTNPQNDAKTQGQNLDLPQSRELMPVGYDDTDVSAYYQQKSSIRIRSGQKVSATFQSCHPHRIENVQSQ